MGIQVAVAGASGYAGGELLRLIVSHPGLEIGPVTAAANAGTRVTDVHPHLTALGDRRFEPVDPDRLAGADLVFLALPHERSADIAAAIPGGTMVVDLSAAFRLADAGSWTGYYHGAHPGHWTYGLPELPGARARIAASTRVAAPGCHATAAIIALAPLLTAGLAEPADIVIVSASGTSGAGRTPTAALLATEVMGSVSPYKAGGVHRHTPEIEQALGQAGGSTTPVVSFTPLLVPMPRGILATCTARFTGPAVRTDDARRALEAAYQHEPFVHLLGGGKWPATAATAGSNAVHLQAAVDARAGRVVVAAALDNLVKGAAGQAVQAANLMLGLEETAGLTAQGIAP